MQRSLIQRKESYIWRTTGYGFRLITFLTLYQRFAFQTPVYCSPLCRWFLSLCHLSESYFRCSATSQAWGTEWQNLWQMQFNSKKCTSMCITLKKYLPPINFRFCGQILENVTSHPYLGVQLDSKLCWKEHIEFVVKSANKILGLIKRNFWFCDESVKLTLYKTLVRPKLEFTTSSGIHIINVIFVE